MKSVQTVVFLGDSITLGYGLENQTERFSSVFCRMTNTIEINYGATGTLMARAGISTADGSSFIDRYPMMEDGDLVIVFGGTNDYFWTDTPISGDMCEDDRYFENAVHHLCSGLKEKYAGKPIVFILPYKMRGIGNYFGGENSLAHNGHNTDQKNYVGHTLIEYVNMQKSICLSYGTLLDSSALAIRLTLMTGEVDLGHNADSLTHGGNSLCKIHRNCVIRCDLGVARINCSAPSTERKVVER